MTALLPEPKTEPKTEQPDPPATPPPGLRLYNSMTRTVEPFETLDPGRVRIYVCGVTPYSACHIGHARSAIVFDVLRRFLEWRGYAVEHVVNFTDVDDKIIDRANAEGREPADVAEGHINDFLDQLRALNVRPATVYPRVTQHIPEIIEFVQGLVERGYAYAVDGDVFFDVARDADYGRLSGKTLERMGKMYRGVRDGVRVDDRKSLFADFALWKAAKPGEPSWPSPWGPGRPGWHIECSAMARAHLGDQIDIHGGGADLVFPHHENEIAQSESLTGKPFARFWMHNGLVQLVDPETQEILKMSKSLGNIITIADFLRRFDGDVLRLMVLNASYRNALPYNDALAEEAVRKLDRLRGAFRPAVGGDEEGSPAAAVRAAAEFAAAQFGAALEDDLNTAGALAAMFTLVRALNAGREAGVGPSALADAQHVLRGFAGVLGLRLDREPADTIGSARAAALMDLLIEVRTELRRTKNFALADLVRDRLAAQGIVLEDRNGETRYQLQQPAAPTPLGAESV